MEKKYKYTPLTEADTAFFRQLYDQYRSFMYFSANHYTSDPTDCDDLVQDASIRLIGNISALRTLDHQKMLKYIALTIRSVYLDGERRRRKENILFLDDESLEALVHDQNLCDHYAYAYSVTQALIDLKSALSRREWLLLEGKYILCLSQEELGSLIGVAPDSVRMLLCRAREKARKILRQTDLE